MDPERAPLAHDSRAPIDPLELALHLGSTQAELARRLDRELANHHGVSFGDFVLLLQLLRAPAGRLRRVELAERVALSASGVTRALVPLERIGLVTREPDPRDARVSYAVLTDVGRRRVEEMTVTAELVSDVVFGTWSPRQRRLLAESLHRLQVTTTSRR